MDSAISKSLTDSLQIQLTQLHNSKIDRSLEIIQTKVQQQKSGSGDCGVFAIANAVQFYFDRYTGTTLL